MHYAGPISLKANDILSQKHLKESVSGKDYGRFKSFTNDGQVLAHLASKEKDSVRSSNVFVMPLEGFPPQELQLPEEIVTRADDNESGKGILTVHSAGFMGPDLSLLVKTLRENRLKAAQDLSFVSVAALHIFPLESLTQLIAADKRKQVLLISGNGRSIEATALKSDFSRNSWSDWICEGLTGIADNPEYIGSMIDTAHSKGLFTTMAIAKTPLSAYELFAMDVGFVHVVAIEKNAVAEFLRDKRDSLTPQLITLLAAYGYREWGTDFLKKADK